MKAIVQNRYGPPEVLEFREIDPPTIDDEQVLVEVHAASVNALDWHSTRGMPYLIRLDGGLRKPKQRVRGVDLAGRVVAVGERVSGIAVGDQVFGGSDGSFAEYTATSPARLARVPTGWTYEQAAALHVAGMTALQGLRDKAQLVPGQKVLINGAGGGVGTFAVQIAKAMGAHVTAVTRAENLDLVRSIGADEVIDYHAEEFTRRSERYDVVFDIGANYPLARCRHVTDRDSVVIVVGSPAGRWLAPATRMVQAAALGPLVRRRMVPFISKNDAASLGRLAELAQNGQLRSVIDRQYPLSEAAAAITYVGAGRARGKVVLQVR